MHATTEEITRMHDTFALGRHDTLPLLCTDDVAVPIP
jgi:hypothetical protein